MIPSFLAPIQSLPNYSLSNFLRGDPEKKLAHFFYADIPCINLYLFYQAVFLPLLMGDFLCPGPKVHKPSKWSPQKMVMYIQLRLDGRGGGGEALR